jgi:hypothetical protein
MGGLGGGIGGGYNSGSLGGGIGSSGIGGISKKPEDGRESGGGRY